MPKTEKIKVKVKKEICLAGSGFHDFYSHTDLYPKNPGKVFEVEVTPFIKRKLATGELIQVSAQKAAKTSGEKEDEKDKKAK